MYIHFLTDKGKRQRNSDFSAGKNANSLFIIILDRQDKKMLDNRNRFLGRSELGNRSRFLRRPKNQATEVD